MVAMVTVAFDLNGVSIFKSALAIADLFQTRDAEYWSLEVT